MERSADHCAQDDEGTHSHGTEDNTAHVHVQDGYMEEEDTPFLILCNSPSPSIKAANLFPLSKITK